MPEVKDVTAAAPEAIAKTAESNPTYVRAKSSRLSIFKGQKIPIRIDKASARLMPASPVLKAFHIRSVSHPMPFLKPWLNWVPVKEQ
jgi:hypothetical protein